MKLYSRLLALIVLFPIHLFSQTYFNERYNIGSQNALNVAHNILFNENDKIIASDFVTTDEYLHYRVGLFTISEVGQIENEIIISDSVWGYVLNGYSGGFKRFSSSSYMAVGLKNRFTDFTVSRGNIYKFDLNLDTVWNKSFGDIEPHDTNYFFRHMDYTLDSSLIILGYIIKNAGSSDVLLMKNDSLGNELWRQYYNSGSLNTGTNVLSLPDGGYAISCYKWQFQSTISHNYLIRTDSLGNELWRRYIGGPLDDGPLFLAWSETDSTIVGAYETADSALTNADSFNRLALIKIDLGNNVVFHKKFMPEKSYEQWNFRVKGITIDSGNNLIVVGRTNEPAYHSEGYLFKFSNSGDSLWYRQYKIGIDNETDHTLAGVTPTPDGGYAAVGYFVPVLSDTGNQDVWVIKVDSMGCIAWDDCWVGQKERIVLQKQKALKIYPNPATADITIVVPKENESEKHLLTIWDMYGRRADEVEVPSGITKVSLNLSGFSPGLYTAVSMHKGRVLFRGKFMKL